MKDTKRQLFCGVIWSVAVLAAATFAGLVFRHWGVQEANVAVVYSFSVLLIARFTAGYVFGIAAAVFSLLLFNWFFTQPYYTLKVDDPTYLVTFCVMIFTSLVTSALTTTAKQVAASREEAARERDRGNLLRAISHDIRTPLSVIMGTSEMLMDATKERSAEAALARTIYHDAQWLHGMVENILNLTKLQAGKLKLEKQPEPVEEVIGAALSVFAKRYPERVVDVEMPGHVLMVPMDAHLVSQLLLNLLDNAAKYTPASAGIQITVVEDSHAVKLTVADRGAGISEAALPKLFNVFYTAPVKGGSVARGVGLGLAICRSIAEAHGGTMSVRNRAGGGAAFTLSLPV
ncbi:MAG: DUF4118 domain-containing protein [Candidatus Spyradenecus sp.]